MVWAIAIPAIAAAVSAGAQWLSSRDAQNATESERARIRNLLNQVQDPAFDTTQIDPEALKLLQQYVPSTIPLIQEAAPQLMTGRAYGADEGRGAQQAALQNLLQVARSGQDPIAYMQQQRAARQASAEARSARQTGAMEAQRRGFGYNPLAANIGAGADAMDRLALSGQAAAAEAANRRQGAIGQVANLGGQLYSQGQDIERQNVQMANEFNRRLAQNAQDIAAQNVGIQNQAQLRNIGEAQRIADANVLARNQARFSNQDMRNTLAQQQFNNRLSKINAQQGVAQQSQNAIMDAARQRNQAMQSMADLVMKGADYYYNRPEQRKDKDNLTRG